MQAHFIFNMSDPADAEAHRHAIKAVEYYSLLCVIDERLRCYLKHGGSEDVFDDIRREITEATQ
jgi:hypothetical protein